MGSPEVFQRAFLSKQSPCSTFTTTSLQGQWLKVYPVLPHSKPFSSLAQYFYSQSCSEFPVIPPGRCQQRSVA
eukprot:1900553-Amphidinium_carterae.1